MFLGEVGWIWRKVSKIQFFGVIKLNTKETFLHITVEFESLVFTLFKKITQIISKLCGMIYLYSVMLQKHSLCVCFWKTTTKKWKIIAPKNNVILSKLVSSHWASLLFGTAFKMEVVPLLLMSTYEAFFWLPVPSLKVYNYDNIWLTYNTHIYSLWN